MAAALTPAQLKRRLRQAGDLVRLAELRRELALRHLAAERAALVAALDAIDAAKDAIRRLDEEQQARREVLVQPLIGSVELRGSLEGVLNTLEADRERLRAAEAVLEEAKAKAKAAQEAVDAARAALLAAERKLDTRKRMREPLVETRSRLRERADEAEAEERRLTRAAPPRGQAA